MSHTSYSRLCVMYVCRHNYSGTSSSLCGRDGKVTCDLNVPNPDDSFIALRANFIVGTSTALPVATVNGNTMQGGVDLSRLTADAPVGTAKNVQGTLTLMSYTLADNGLRLGCTIDRALSAPYFWERAPAPRS